MVLTKRSWNLPLICQICGDKARGMNFEVMTCMSCKAFFRRHALQPICFLQCQRDNHCEITLLTRGNCSACRLRKCFSFGMNPKLIRYESKNHNRLPKNKNKRLPQPSPLNLLQSDTSTLTKIEWDLLSNIIHAYDRGNSIEHTKNLLEQQAAVPPKLRSKAKSTLDIIGYYYSAMISFLERVPYFHDLPIGARQALIQHNSITLGAYNSLLIVREANGLDYSSYIVGCQNLWGYENYILSKKFISTLEQNGTLVKIMLLITAFSENCSIVSLDYTESMVTMTSTRSLVRIQNILVTMLWKYLIYQYGFLGAVKCFNSFIKYVLNIIRWTAANPSTQHSDMVDTIVENTTRLLTMHD
ncbi:unnamed protein product [Rotaria sp. Silwood1]|nr:unnamed protein product [Rotaria sp. Silwood1]CAF3359176.1 unnamed protein product [Rotaria sp. Silwood1]CAF4577611.1 unnamed protein product [Rotaria sp. Silwood1]